MKKIALLLYGLLFSLAMMGQDNAHLKFKGIPITGTITQFQSQLTQKGCTYDKEQSSYAPAGIRAFNATFIGNKVRVYAFFDTNTEIVYRVKVVISGVSENRAEREYDKTKSLLSQKYGTEYMITSTENNKEAANFVSLKDSNFSSQNPLDVYGAIYGFISLYITQDEDPRRRFPNNWNVHIVYEDSENSYKHSQQQLDEI